MLVMKYRESGMPPEDLWNTFFDASTLLKLMAINQSIRTLVDVGCGYGTFLLPMSKVVQHKVIGIDIDQDMLKVCQKKLDAEGASNIELIHGDISDRTTLQLLGKYKHTIDYVSLFNILHCEEPTNLLNHIFELLCPGGRIGVIHWIYEDTPRGPSMEIRPKPETIMAWASKASFRMEGFVDLPPYHYGLIFMKP